ncbi:MAG: hypothetical protein ACK4PR_08265, partial [Gammaproteobacteria bacterium]
ITPLQCEIFDELTPEQVKIIKTLTVSQKETLRGLSYTQYQALKNFNSDTKLMAASLPNKLILQEIMARINTSGLGIYQKDMRNELSKMQLEIEEQITILLTKMSVLTAADNDVNAVGTEDIRLRLCQQYSFQDNLEISSLISSLMLFDAENYNIDYSNYNDVQKALKLNKQENCLTLFLLQCLCDGGKENDIALAMIRLNNISCLTIQFVKLFKDKSDFSLQVAEVINKVNPAVIEKNKQQLNELLDDILSSEKSPSNFFPTIPTQSANKEKIFELLGCSPTSPSNTLDNNMN